MREARRFAATFAATGAANSSIIRAHTLRDQAGNIRRNPGERIEKSR
jgi:hypothetical protein